MQWLKYILCIYQIGSSLFLLLRPYLDLVDHFQFWAFTIIPSKNFACVFSSECFGYALDHSEHITTACLSFIGMVLSAKFLTTIHLANISLIDEIRAFLTAYSTEPNECVATLNLYAPFSPKSLSLTTRPMDLPRETIGLALNTVSKLNSVTVTIRKLRFQISICKTRSGRPNGFTIT